MLSVEKKILLDGILRSSDGQPVPLESSDPGRPSLRATTSGMQPRIFVLCLDRSNRDLDLQIDAGHFVAAAKVTNMLGHPGSRVVGVA